MEIRDNTPWGTAQTVKDYGPGIVMVETASHGGFRVLEPQLSQIPQSWRDASFNGQGRSGWFEEDCDWCMVVKAFPDRFPADMVKAAEQTFSGWIMKKLPKVSA